MGTSITYAGFGRRLVASLIDNILLLIVLALVLIPLSSSGLLHSNDQQLSQIMINLIPMLIVIVFWLKFGATPGKQLLDCQIVDSRTGESLRVGQSIVRYFAYILSTLPFLLGFFWVIWSKRSQGFHDMLAHTVVIYNPQKGPEDIEAQRNIQSFLKEYPDA